MRRISVPARLPMLVLPPTTWSAFLCPPLPVPSSPGEQSEAGSLVDLLFARPSPPEVVGEENQKVSEAGRSRRGWGGGLPVFINSKWMGESRLEGATVICLSSTLMRAHSDAVARMALGFCLSWCPGQRALWVILSAGVGGWPGRVGMKKGGRAQQRESTRVWNLPTFHPTHICELYVPLVQSPDTRQRISMGRRRSTLARELPGL